MIGKIPLDGQAHDNGVCCNGKSDIIHSREYHVGIDEENVRHVIPKLFHCLPHQCIPCKTELFMNNGHSANDVRMLREAIDAISHFRILTVCQHVPHRNKTKRVDPC